MGLYRVGDQAADDSGLVRIPFMLPTLCAGFPSPAEDFIEDALELPRWLVPNPPATFIWRVRGWPMKGAGIHDEDLAVVDRSLSPSADRAAPSSPANTLGHSPNARLVVTTIEVVS